MPEKKERPLPAPPKTAFDLHGHYEEREGQPLLADELARAAAEGRLDDFLDKEVPDNDYARTLVSMMMGMTGMAPVAGSADGEKKDAVGEETVNPPGPPVDVVEAVRGGDVQRLKGLLQREQRKRSQEEEPEEPGKMADKNVKPTIEKDIIEQLLRIASDNNLTLDWLFLRAIKLYVQEYQNTGRL